jgi:hypothetical protein
MSILPFDLHLEFLSGFEDLRLNSHVLVSHLAVYAKGLSHLILFDLLSLMISRGTNYEVCRFMIFSSPRFLPAS